MKRPVMVTTVHRGVFYGYLDGMPKTLPQSVTLQDARNCVYWSMGTKGFLGLASSGPSDDCRIGPKVNELTLYDVTSITPCSDEAAKRWEEGPWN